MRTRDDPAAAALELHRRAPGRIGLVTISIGAELDGCSARPRRSPAHLGDAARHGGEHQDARQPSCAGGRPSVPMIAITYPESRSPGGSSAPRQASPSPGVGRVPPAHRPGVRRGYTAVNVVVGITRRPCVLLNKTVTPQALRQDPLRGRRGVQAHLDVRRRPTSTRNAGYALIAPADRQGVPEARRLTLSPGPAIARSPGRRAPGGRPTRRPAGGGLLLAERPLVEPELEQEVQRLAHVAPGGIPSCAMTWVPSRSGRIDAVPPAPAAR